MLFIVLVMSLAGCHKNSHYFCDNHRVINTPKDSDVLASELFITGDSAAGTDYIYSIGGYLVATSYDRNNGIFAVYDSLGTFMGRFGSFGMATNEFSQGMKPNGQFHNGVFFVNDVNLNTLKAIDLQLSLDSARCMVNKTVKTGNRAMAAFYLDGDDVLFEQETYDSYRIVIIDQDTKSIKKNLNLYKPHKNPFDTYADIAFISPDKKRIVLAMRFLNQVNFLSLEDNKRKSVSLYEDAFVCKDKSKGREFYCDVTADNSYIYALYMNQSRDDAYEKAKPMEIHVFNWAGNFIKKMIVNEYIVHISVSTNGTLYGCDLDDNIYKYKTV